VAKNDDPKVEAMGLSGNIIILSKDAKEELIRQAKERDAARRNAEPVGAPAPAPGCRMT